MSDEAARTTVEGIPRVRPTVSIYQNPEHVAGILQQLHVSPLLVDESREQGSTETTSEKAETKGRAGVKADARLPGVGGLSVDVSGDRGATLDDGLKAESKTVQKFTYSQAYYLFEVRNALWRRSQVRTVSGVREAEQIEVGDFVEFQATFRPNALHSILDIVTQELVGKIVDQRVRLHGIATAPEFDDFEKYRIYLDKFDVKAKAAADVARAAVDAVRVDFRAEKTREFYGEIGDSEVTAITICDGAHFVVEDEDRILDGSFSVLGKVTSKVEWDLPVLNRNKLLDRLSPDLVDSIFGMIRDAASKEALKLDTGGGEELEFDDAFDLALPSRVNGPSFKVVPIAIYV